MKTMVMWDQGAMEQTARGPTRAVCTWSSPLHVLGHGEPPETLVQELKRLSSPWMTFQPGGVGPQQDLQVSRLRAEQRILFPVAPAILWQARAESGGESGQWFCLFAEVHN